MIVTAPLFAAAPDGGPVDIVHVQPQGFPDSGVFTEVAETLRHGFRALGYDAQVQPGVLRFGVPLVVLAAHLLSADDTLRLPVGAIIYNLEQMRPGAWATRADYLALLARHTVWDFAAANVTAIRAATGNPAVHHVPIGYAAPLTRIAPAPVQDIDVLFYGSITPRRDAVLRALAAEGLQVVAGFRVYGEERDALIARAKVVLNLHAHDDWGFEIVRVAHLLANRKAVVCEAATPDAIDGDLRHAVRGVPYAGLVDACRALVHDAVARGVLEAAGWEAFRARDEAAILRAALCAPAVVPGAVRAVASASASAPGPVTAPGPMAAPVATDAAALREAYLDLLAKSLTNQIYGDAPFDYWSGGRFDPQMRSLGRDWPSQAMTMIGDRRLDNIRQLFAAIVAAEVPGDLIETGVWRGGACIFMRGLLRAYGIGDRRVWVADSFAGLPPPDPQYAQDSGDQHHSFAQLAVSLETVQENFRRFDLLDAQVAFLPGWFAETLPAAPIVRLALLRLDGDMYGSTIDALAALYHKVSPGGFVIVDDYGAVAACRAAVTDFRQARGVTAPIVDIDGLGVYWRVPG
jgi:O-methyltransferase/8-demethyl-8-(2,3-dimethoxy-alpha-L-rhamnosyl)tetracenomycin-C 4'-O-methyltransferase